MKNKSILEQEFVSLVKQYERVIYNFCTFYMSEISPLEDLYQEVVLNLWKAFPNFRNESQTSTWIYRIALNTCISDFRRNAKLRQNVPLSFITGFSVALIVNLLQKSSNFAIVNFNC